MRETSRAPRAAHHLGGLDGLRGLASLALLAYHVWLFGLAAELRADSALPFALRCGLILFFVLSGLVIYRPFAQALLRGEARPGTRRYLRHRALRILPAYWVALIVSSYVLGATFTQWPGELGAITDPLMLLANLALVQNMTEATYNSGIAPTWSLAVEAGFYLLVPLLAAVAYRAGRRRGGWLPALVPIGILAAVGFTFRYAHDHGMIGDPVLAAIVNTSILAYGELFAVGMAVALWIVAVGDGRLRAPGPHVHRVLLGASAAGLVALVAGGTTAQGGAGSNDLLIALVAGLLLAGVVAPASRRLPDALERRAPRALGLWSFSVFLWHTPVIFFLTERGVVADTWPEAAGMLLAVTGLSVGAAAVTYRFVERPALAHKDPAPRRAPSRAPAGVLEPAG